MNLPEGKSPIQSPLAHEESQYPRDPYLGFVDGRHHALMVGHQGRGFVSTRNLGKMEKETWEMLGKLRQIKTS